MALNLLPNTAKQKRIAALAEEMSSLHLANLFYWKQAESTREARAEYQRRVDRLEEIRRELLCLRPT